MAGKTDTEKQIAELEGQVASLKGDVLNLGEKLLAKSVEVGMPEVTAELTKLFQSDEFKKLYGSIPLPEIVIKNTNTQ